MEVVESVAGRAESRRREMDSDAERDDKEAAAEEETLGVLAGVGLVTHVPAVGAVVLYHSVKIQLFVVLVVTEAGRWGHNDLQDHRSLVVVEELEGHPVESVPGRAAAGGRRLATLVLEVAAGVARPPERQTELDPRLLEQDPVVREEREEEFVSVVAGAAGVPVGGQQQGAPWQRCPEEWPGSPKWWISVYYISCATSLL